MIPPDETADVPPLTVEHRLRIALSLLDYLQRLSTAADDSSGIPLFVDVPTFARVVWQLARNAEVQVQAVTGGAR